MSRSRAEKGSAEGFAVHLQALAHPGRLGGPVGRSAVFLAVVFVDLHQLAKQRTLRDVHDAGSLAQVHLALDVVRYFRDGHHDVPHQTGLEDGIAGGFLEQHPRLEIDEVRPVLLQVFLELLGGMLARERIGIVVVRKGEHAHVHVGRQQHVDAPERSLDAGGVAVVEHGDVLGEAFDQADLPVGERGAGGGHHVLHPGLVHGYDVRIALHQVARILPHDGIFGLIEAVEDVALVVDRVFG